MTANQINYQKYLEDVRSHRANEAISKEQAEAATSQAQTARSKLAIDTLNAQANLLNAETNQSAVGAQWYGAQANAAYQQAMAAVSQAQQKEQVRHNKAGESNDLIMSGQRVTAQNYATQKGYESTELQVRGQLINTLINNVGGIAREIAPNLIPGLAKGVNSLITSFGG